MRSFFFNREIFAQLSDPFQLKLTKRSEIEQFKWSPGSKKGAKLNNFQFDFAIFRHFFKIRQLKSRFSKMRKSGSAVLLLLGYANSVDAMTRVRRGVFDDWFDKKDAAEAEDATTATTTTADPFDDSFFQERIRLLNYEWFSFNGAYQIIMSRGNNI